MPGLRTGLIAGIVMVLSGCLNPLDESDITQSADTTAPTIGITSPTENQHYLEAITLSGTVTDSVDGGSGGRISSASYQVSGILGERDPVALSIDQSGAFSATISTLDLDGDFTITVSARDWNDNIAQRIVTLRDPGVELPSFSVSAGDGEVVLEWEGSDAVGRYDIAYTDTGAVPSPSFATIETGVTSPFTLSDLENGNLYSFMLSAYYDAAAPAGSAADLVSGLSRAIPLSGTMLFPTVSVAPDGNRVEWPAIDGTDEFIVYRGEVGEELLPLTAPIRTTSFLDTNISDGTGYWYAVAPSLEGSAVSDHAYFHTPVSRDHTIRSDFKSGGALSQFAVPLGEDVAQMQRIGNVLFVLGTTQLTTYDIGTPGAPTLIDQESLSGNYDVALNSEITSRGVMAIDDGTVVLGSLYTSPVRGTSSNGWVVEVLSVDPYGALAYLGRTAVQTNNYQIGGVAITGDYAFLAAGQQTFRVDFTNPASPMITSGVLDRAAGSPDNNGSDTDLLPHDSLLLVGSTLFTAGEERIDITGGTPGYDFSIDAFDVSNPSAPTRLSGFPFTKLKNPDGWLQIFGMSAIGNRLFVGTAFDGFQMVNVTDINNPSAPSEPSPRFADSGGLDTRFPATFADDGRGWLWTRNGRLVPLRSAGDSVEISLGGIKLDGHGFAVVTADGSRVFLGSASDGTITEYDLGAFVDPDPVIRVATTPTTALELVGSHLVAGSATGTLTGYAVTADGSISPDWTIQLATGGHPINTISGSDGNLIVGYGSGDELPSMGTSGGIAIVDITGAPVVLSTIDLGGTIVDLHRHGSLLVATGKPGVELIDVTDPQHPVRIDRTGNSISASALRWPYLYGMAADEQGYVYDVSQPAILTLPDPFDYGAWTQYDATDIAVFNSTMFVLQTDGKLLPFSLYNPAAPKVQGSVFPAELTDSASSTAVVPAAMALGHDMAVVVAQNDELWVVDISMNTPQNEQLSVVGRYQFPEPLALQTYTPMTDVVLRGSDAYVAGLQGIYKVRVIQ